MVASKHWDLAMPKKKQLRQAILKNLLLQS